MLKLLSCQLFNVKQRLNSINGHAHDSMCCGCHLPAFTLWKLLFPSEFDVSWETLELGETSKGQTGIQ